MGINMGTKNCKLGRKIVFLALIGLIFGILLVATSCKDNKTVLHVTYDICVSVPESADRAYVKTSVNFKNTSGAPLEELIFYIYPAIDAEEGGIRVSNVSSAGTDLAYTTDGYLLTASLVSPLAPDEDIVIEIGSTVIGDKKSRFVKNADGTLKLFRFYPSLAYLGSDGFEVKPYSVIGDSFKDPVADFKLTVRLAEGLEALSGGNCSVNENGETVYELNTARCVGLVVGTDTVKSESANGTTVKAMGYDGDVKELLDVLNRMEDIVGKYPYGSFSIACTGTSKTDVASGTAMLSKKASVFDIAYAMAKQWFGSLIGSDGYSEGWVADAFSEHIASLTFSQNPEAYGAIISESRSALETYRKAVARTYGDNYIVRADACTCDYKTEFGYDTVVRRGGSVMYAGLKNVVGNKKYYKCIKSYVEEFEGDIASGEDVKSFLSSALGMDVKGIIDAYLGCEVK